MYELCISHFKDNFILHVSKERMQEVVYNPRHAIFLSVYTTIYMYSEKIK